MRLTVFSDYALRVLIYLGLRQDGLVTIGEIAQAYAISHNHLMKVVQCLATLGHVETVRGKGGGLRLRRPPSEINIGAVLRATEEGSALVECFDRAHANCRITAACALPAMLREALLAFFQALDRYTLADLLRHEEHLAPLLGTARQW